MFKKILLSSVLIAGFLGVSTTQINANNDHGWGTDHPWESGGGSPWIITDVNNPSASGGDPGWSAGGPVLPWGGGFPWESK
ncbi:hypothetical protein [Priestia taiwanensis]|uniref:Uncharacterized protein n=1 Tax=Priestia taiwanensis TaxID=1347902 RepID=A0A917AK54_9BACI|nr:hypothetical protein [Priestia taiwanensis]MBM7361976.1 hypothetical protein [Priestia taiwanensis]GGE58460.1 hypothetical protein GCM10007140_06020 [Priestia taiwanensis]